MPETQSPSTDFTATVDAYYLSEYLSAVDAIVDEMKVDVTETGFRTAAVDPANVAMVETSLHGSAFQDEITDAAAGQTIGLGNHVLVPVLEDAVATVVELAYDSDTRKLDIAFDRGRYQYTHGCLDPESIRQEPTIPEMDLAFEADLNADYLRDAVQWVNEFTKRVRIGYDPDAETFWLEGQSDIDHGVYEVDRGDLGAVRKAGAADSLYSLDYLTDIVEAIPPGRTVTVRVGEEFPLKLSYNIYDEITDNGGEEHHGEVMFMQAPRIQSD